MHYLVKVSILSLFFATTWWIGSNNSVSAQVHANSETSGLVNRLPADSGLMGTWTINGMAFTITPTTRLEAKYGNFVEGTCVELKYHSPSQTVTKIEMERPDKCISQGKAKLYGRIDQLPAGGALIGEWTINGVTVSATPSTDFESRYGGFFPGACVKLEYVNTNMVESGAMAIEIEPEDDDKCYGSKESKLYGMIEQVPADGNLIGEWTIDGRSYTTTFGTEFESKYGNFAAGTCVKAEYRNYNPSNGSRTDTAFITEIETASMSKCGGYIESKSLGTIDAMPTGNGLIGTWRINEQEFNATAGTRFKAKYGNFTQDSCVSIKYIRPTVQQTQSATAISTATLTEVEMEEIHECSGYGESKRYGRITNVPTTGSATESWAIDNVTYTTTPTTKFKMKRGPLGVGACVELEYIAPTQTAIAIESAKESKCNQGRSKVKTYGRIHQMPAGGAFMGTWNIDGVNYTAMAGTSFKAKHAMFAVETCVEIEYYSGTMVLDEIETANSYKCSGY